MGYRFVVATESTHWNARRKNAIQKTLPIALMIGSGKLRGKGNEPNIAPTNRIIAIRRRSQKFSLMNSTPKW
jgi:hypothetical protein